MRPLDRCRPDTPPRHRETTRTTSPNRRLGRCRLVLFASRPTGGLGLEKFLTTARLPLPRNRFPHRRRQGGQALSAFPSGGAVTVGPLIVLVPRLHPRRREQHAPLTFEWPVDSFLADSAPAERPARKRQNRSTLNVCSKDCLAAPPGAVAPVAVILCCRTPDVLNPPIGARNYR